MQSSWLSYYTTDWGIGAVAVSCKGLRRVWLPGDRTSTAALHNESELSQYAANQLELYFQGRLQHFELPLDMSEMTTFRQQVLQLTSQIPYGTTTTYGALARALGAPAAARAVGGALAANPIPVVIPCHRVVASTGALTGFSAEGGILMKKLLLSLEHVDMSTIRLP